MAQRALSINSIVNRTGFCGSTNILENGAHEEAKQVSPPKCVSGSCAWCVNDATNIRRCGPKSNCCVLNKLLRC